MAKANEKATPTEATKDPLVKVDKGQYQKATTATGNTSLNNGDPIATLIEGMENDELYEIAGKFLAFPVKVGKAKIEDAIGLQSAYGKLNVGMQRMNLGNRFRGRVAAIDKANEKALAKAKTSDKDGNVDQKAIDKAAAAKSGIDKLTAIASPFVKAVAARKADEEKAKAKAAEASAEKKAPAKKKKAA